MEGMVAPFLPFSMFVSYYSCESTNAILHPLPFSYVTIPHDLIESYETPL
jgi:hypothetical protein